jgi:putative chitinase
MNGDDTLAISLDLLRRITGPTHAMPPPWVPDSISNALPLAAISTPLRTAHFLAQTGWESAFFTAYEEPDEVAVTHPYGIQWKGRGAIQITWQPNYVRLSAWFSMPDLLATPALVCTPAWAFRSAAWYWVANNLNAFADADDVAGLSMAINGKHCTTLYQRAYLTNSAKVALGLTS